MTTLPSAGLARDTQPLPDLHARLAALLPAHCHAPVLGFAAVVVRQVAHPLGAPPGDAAEAEAREQRVAARLAAALRAACGNDTHSAPDDVELDRAAALLASDPVLLSACFQNTDLLPPNGGPVADHVALIILRALERLAATPMK